MRGKRQKKHPTHHRYHSHTPATSTKAPKLLNKEAYGKLHLAADVLEPTTAFTDHHTEEGGGKSSLRIQPTPTPGWGAEGGSHKSTKTIPAGTTAGPAAAQVPLHGYLLSTAVYTHTHVAVAALMPHIHAGEV